MKYLVGITRELDQESPMYFYTIYTSNIWSMLMINNVYVSTMSIQYIYHKLNMLLTYTLMSFFQLFLLDSRPMTSCHVMSCDHGHMPLHYPRKREIKSKKIDKKNRKSK